MASPDRFLAAFRIHKRWADRYSLLFIVLLVGLAVGATLLGQLGNADAGTRTEMLVVVVGIVVVVCIWQAAGLVVARIDVLISNWREGMETEH